MAEWIKHIETYVDTPATSSPNQDKCVAALASLIRSDSLTLETLVREMGMYLTTTDNIVRSKGIFLLAQILEQLASKPFSSTSISSLIGFFTERLADWQAVRGAVVGCLSLLRRKNDVGTVTVGEVEAVARSYLLNLELRSMAQLDRKLSFQLMECLLDHHSGAIQHMGTEFLHGILAAMDGEKDPVCLLLVFHIVECLARIYPDSLETVTEEVFEILGSYFPIHFTHPKAEDDDVKREELSRALMLAFASTPLFEPLSIPLLLEKVSSSLPLAKLDSFRFLSYCTAKYGPDSMAEHAEALWSAIKDATYMSIDSTLSKGFESMGGMSFQESDIMTHAFVLLQEIIRQRGDFIRLIIGDNDINMFMNSLSQYKEFDDIPFQVKQRLHSVGRILSTCAKSSGALCDKVFESFFASLMNVLGIYDVDRVIQVRFNFGALYLCIELLTACRSLNPSLENFRPIPDSTGLVWRSMLGFNCKQLVEAFISISRTYVSDNAQSPHVYFGVKGLQVLATFPESFPPIFNIIYGNILSELLGIVASHSDNTFVWSLALKALVEIGIFIDKCPDTEKAANFESIVVNKIVSLISSDDSTLPSSLKLEAAFEIGATRKKFMRKIVQGLDEAIHTIFYEVNDGRNHESDKLMVKLLDTYSQKVLPWFLDIGGDEEVPLNFALSIWDKIENMRLLNLNPSEIANGTCPPDVLGATMTAMKKAVGSCSEKSQEIIINKSSQIIFSKEEVLQKTRNIGNYSKRDEWLTSLFASVFIALRPKTSIPNGKVILQLFITSLVNGHISSAHALGSLVNKLPLEITGIDSSRSFSLSEALDIIFHNFVNDGRGVSLRSDKLRIESEINTVTGLAWIGKGLLMRGHEKVKDVTMALLSFLTLDGEAGGSKELKNLTEEFDKEDLRRLMICAGDAFCVIMSDCEECLNRTNHAIMRPLYKQRFFSTIMPILLSLVVKAESSFGRSMLHRAIAHVLSDTPLTAILGDAKKLVPTLLGCLSTLNKDALNKDIIYNLLLVLSGILVEKNGQDAAIENAPGIVNHLVELTTYSHKMAIRETALQCLFAVSELPYTRIYPLREKVLKATSKALDDPKRIVRQEAVRCRHAWASKATRSLHF